MHPLLGDPQLLRSSLDKIQILPTLPSVVSALIALGADPKSSLTEIIQVISYDPVATASVLRLANSSYMGLKNPIPDLPSAVFHLGIGEIRRMANEIKTSDVFAPGGETNEYFRKLWLHSLITAFIGHSIATSGGFDFNEEAYAGGLLHDFGKLYFATSFPEQYAPICEQVVKGRGDSRDFEKEVFGLNHLDIAAILFKQWHFPASLIAVATRHHEPGRMEGESRPLVLCIAAANVLAHYALADEPGDFLARAEDWLTELSESSSQPEAMGTDYIQAILETAVMRAHMFEGIAD